MKNIIRMAILCAFLSLYSIQDTNIQENNHNPTIEAKKNPKLKKMTLYEQAVNIVTSKVFWGGIFKGMFLSAPFYVDAFTNLLKKEPYLELQSLSDFEKPLPMNQITLTFKSLARSAHVYLFQHYLRHLGHRIKEIFNISTQKIVLVINDNDARFVSENYIFMPFRDAIDITKLKQFLGVLAHEVVHLKNKHSLLGQIFYYACFAPLMYNMYKIAVKIRDNAHDTLFEDLFESSFVETSSCDKSTADRPADGMADKSEDKPAADKKKIILYFSYFLYLVALTGGSYFVAHNVTKIIGNLTWRNYFERQADSFTHENQHTQKNLLSGLIDFFKSRLTEEKREYQNSWLHPFFDPHPKTEDRIAKLSNQLHKIKSQIDK